MSDSMHSFPPSNANDMDEVIERTSARFGEIQNAAVLSSAEEQIDPDEALFQQTMGDDEGMDDIAMVESHRIEPEYHPTDTMLPWRPVNETFGGRSSLAVRARTMLRSVFRQLPCFGIMEERSHAAGRDPMMELFNLRNQQGMGPTPPHVMSDFIQKLRDDGNIIGKQIIEFPSVMQGYQPEVTLAATERDSYLIVEEKRSMGAPGDAQYVYVWQGGRQVYENNPEARQALARMGGDIVRSVNTPAPAETARNVSEVPPVAQEAVVRLDEPSASPQAERTVPEQAPLAEEKPNSPVVGRSIQSLRNFGYEMVNEERGMTMHKELEDGNKAIVVGDGKSLIVAQSFLVEIEDAAGELIDSVTLTTPAEILDWVDSKASPSMKM